MMMRTSSIMIDLLPLGPSAHAPRVRATGSSRWPDPAVLAAHVRALCVQHAIEWTVDRGIAGAACRNPRRIRTSRVRGPVSYLIALHEIAHVVAPVEPVTLENEAACWRWALSMSLWRPTGRTRRSLARRLLSYLARELDQTPDQIPPPGAAFWSTLWSLEPDLQRRYDRHAGELAAAGGGTRRG
jgi:hypothetical protein